ncbi:MCP four helix bundle domain-containing protein [Herbaspirillum huttiense]|uniref:MCP four helix bundle domain-containing protein n=2 Tax=Herbaspirillum huttiense TaxID=863372 RepID=A0AAJ2LTL0_9BURK|nr:MCP four helix bundle domain-containing protein [Herbaspirillum huttiense]MDR9836405.1 MCP four helix bundle domain-containing protein [Herbaspirillum huttiense]
MTFVKKLYAMAAIAIVGVLLLASIATHHIERVDSAASYASANTVPSILELDSVIEAVYSKRIVIWKYLANPNSAHRQEAEKILTESFAKIAKALDTYEKEDISDATDAQMLKDVRQHIATYDASLAKVMILAQKDAVAARNAMAADQAIVDTMMSALDKQKKYNQKLGKAAAQTATATKNQAMVTALAISALIAALVGMILYFLLARSAHPSQ